MNSPPIVSVAVFTLKGVVEPILRNHKHMNLAEIEEAVNHFCEKAKNMITATDRGGTFIIARGNVRNLDSDLYVVDGRATILLIAILFVVQ